MSDSSGNVTFSSTFTGNSFVTFGEDVNGELYVGSIGNGIIYKIIDTSLGVAENDKKAFNVYPNPAKSEVFISSTSASIYAIGIEINDLNGKVLHSQKNDNLPIHSINTENLSSGLYLLKVMTNLGTVATYKLAKR